METGITNYDRDDINNIRLAVSAYVAYLKKAAESAPTPLTDHLFAEYAELESRLSNMVTLTGKAI